MTGARDLRPSRILLIAFGLVLLFEIAAQIVPLPPPPDLTLASTFGVHDNRRLLLRYGGMVAAMLLAPWLSGRISPGYETKRSPARSWTRSILLTLPLALGGWWFFFGSGIRISAINGHEMVHLGYLSQMQHGAVLNVDTFMNYGPLLGTSIFGFMKIFGFHLAGFRWYWHAAALLVWILVVVAAWRNLRHPVIALLLALYALLYTALISFLPDRSGIYHAAWGWANPLRHGAPVLCMVFLGGGLLRGRLWAALLAGSFVAATTFYAQETGLASFIALGALLLMGGRLANLRNLLAAFGVGLAAVFVAICLPALLRGELGSFLHATFEAPRIVLEGAANKPFPVLGGPGSWPYYILPVTMLVLLLYHGIRIRSGSQMDGIPFALAAYGSIVFVTLLVRADRSHWLNIALGFWFLVFLDLDRVRSAIDPRSYKKAFWFAVPLLPLVFLTPGPAALIRAGEGRLARPLPPSGWIKLDLPRGGIWVPSEHWFEGEPQNHGDLRGVELIRSLAKDRPTQILGSQASLYYFLTGVRAAVPYTDLSTQCVTEYHRRRLIATYFKNKPDYTFMFTEFESKPPRPATGYRRLGDRYGLGVYQREDLAPIALP